MKKLFEKIFKQKEDTQVVNELEEKKIEIKEESKKDIVYPDDSLSFIEKEYCKQQKKESNCNTNEKFSVKNFMLKNSD